MKYWLAHSHHDIKCVARTTSSRHLLRDSDAVATRPSQSLHDVGSISFMYDLFAGAERFVCFLEGLAEASVLDERVVLYARI